MQESLLSSSPDSLNKSNDNGDISDRRTPDDFMDQEEDEPSHRTAGGGSVHK